MKLFGDVKYFGHFWKWAEIDAQWSLVRRHRTYRDARVLCLEGCVCGTGSSQDTESSEAHAPQGIVGKPWNGEWHVTLTRETLHVARWWFFCMTFTAYVCRCSFAVHRILKKQYSETLWKRWKKHLQKSQLHFCLAGKTGLQVSHNNFTYVRNRFWVSCMWKILVRRIKRN